MKPSIKKSIFWIFTAACVPLICLLLAPSRAGMAQTMLDSSHASTQRESNSAIIPVPKLENDFYDWYARHDAVIKLIGKQKVDLVFIGDSITHMFGGQPESNICHGAAVWDKYYSKRNAVNLGFGWDRTQNVLWRLQHGELEGIAPKAAVLLIGTNNLTGTEHARINTPSEIAAAIEEICKTIQEKAPHCRIILLGVLPRLETKGPKNGFEKPIREINTLLARLDKKEGITFMDLTEKFAGPDGLPRPELMEDSVHPSARGYEVMATALEPELSRLLGE